MFTAQTLLFDFIEIQLPLALANGLIIIFFPGF